MLGFGQASYNDPSKGHKPPPPPTPLTFPAYGSIACPEGSETRVRDKPPSFDILFGLRTPADVTLEHFRTLNVSLNTDQTLEDLLRPSADGRTYIPPRSQIDHALSPSQLRASPTERENTSAQASTDAVTLTQCRHAGNHAKAPSCEDFITRQQELMADNDDAFRVIARVPPAEGRSAPRIAHYRRFFEHLDMLSQYWDTSLDHYFTLSPQQRAFSLVPGVSALRPCASLVNKFDRPRSIHSTGTQELAAHPSPLKRAKPSPPSPESATSPETELYTGWRTSTGSLASALHLLDGVRTFIEPIAWAFGLQLQAPRRPPQLCIQNVRMPVRLDGSAFIIPKDRLRARRGEVIGPLLGIQSRPYVDFGGHGGNGNGKGNANNGKPRNGQRKVAVNTSMVDLLGEVSALLFLAQERAREGHVEILPGAGTWWTTVPRWGGGLGGEVGDAADSKEDPTPRSDASQAATKSYAQAATAGKAESSGRKGKWTPTGAWKVVKPGSGLWDPRTTYKAVGKESESDWDDVFLISALNHHISILCLHVHTQYTDFLTTGTHPDPPPADGAWCSPTLSRTRWYDLLDKEQRVEAMRGIWAVLAYLTRTP